MKKGLKVGLIIILIIVLLVGIDISNILLRNKPIFAIKEDCDCLEQVYRGLFYDTYNCWEYPTSQIKPKWSKFSCSENDNNTIIYGKITQLLDSSIVIQVLENSASLKVNDEARITLLNNPVITGANNLIIGQYILIKPKLIQETYPVVIITDKIDIINE